KKYKILLIEDDADQILMYQTKFEKDGYEFISANNGTKGLELAKKEKPDIILLDIVMDEMDGIEVLKRIRADEETSDLKVILLTNLVVKEKIDEGKKFGALDYIIKSQVEPSNLVKRVRKFLKN
ncbi:MAG: Response regulator receiver protein, partial [Parcubacteria group bacterium GW2011_GWA2_38_13]